MDMMENLFKMGSSLVIVLAVLMVAAAAARRWLMPAVGTAPHYSLRIGGSVSLGGRRSVVVLEVGGRTLVVGTTPQNLVLLAQFDKEIDALPALNAANAQNPATPSGFLRGVRFIRPRVSPVTPPAPCFPTDPTRQEVE